MRMEPLLPVTVEGLPTSLLDQSRCCTPIRQAVGALSRSTVGSRGQAPAQLVATDDRVRAITLVQLVGDGVIVRLVCSVVGEIGGYQHRHRLSQTLSIRVGPLRLSIVATCARV